MANHEKPANDPSLEPAADPSPGQSADTPPEPTVSRVPQKVTRTSSPLTAITLVIALVAVGLAVWALVSQPEEAASAGAGTGAGADADAGTGTGTEAAQPGDPKQRLCDAAQVVAVAVQLQTNANAGTDTAAVEAVAANARLAMLGGGEYLLSQIDAATPAELVDPARSFGTTLRVLGITALAGVPGSDPGNQERIREWEKARNTLGELCTQ